MVITEALVSDATGTVRCVWFQQPYLAHAFHTGSAVVVAGLVEADEYGMHIVSPIIERDQPETLHTGRLVPVYPLSYGISQKQLRLLMHAALPFACELPETLSEGLRASEQLSAIDVAVRQVHFPSDAEALDRARARFAFEEVFTYFLRVRASREELDRANAPAIPLDEEGTRLFVAQLPFSLTHAQERAVGEILSDMAGSPSPSRSPSQREGEKSVMERTDTVKVPVPMLSVPAQTVCCGRCNTTSKPKMFRLPRWSSSESRSVTGVTLCQSC